MVSGVLDSATLVVCNAKDAWRAEFRTVGRADYRGADDACPRMRMLSLPKGCDSYEKKQLCWGSL